MCAVDGAVCRLMAQPRPSAPARPRSAYRRLTDVRGSMSVNRHIPDAKPSGAEGRSLTQCRHEDRFVATARCWPLVDRTRRLSPLRLVDNRLKVIRNLWPSRDGHRVRFVGFCPLGSLTNDLRSPSWIFQHLDGRDHLSLDERRT